MPEIDTAHEAVPASEQAEKRTEQTHSLMIGNAIGGQVRISCRVASRTVLRVSLSFPASMNSLVHE